MQKIITKIGAVIMLLFVSGLITTHTAQAQSSANYRMPWYSADSSGGGFSSGNGMQLYSNVGQSIVGTSSNSNYQLTSGYGAFFRRDTRPVVLIIASLDNDLDFYWEDVINDAEKAASDGNHVRLLIDGAGDGNSYAFDVLPDTNPFCPSIKANNVSCGRYQEGVNMEAWTEDITHPSSIYRFITEAMADHPHADSVTLSLMGHGAGWSANVLSVQPRGWGEKPRGWGEKPDPWPDRPDLPDDHVPGGGFLWDDFPNEHGATSLSITDLRRILDGVFEKTGRKIDLVYFDACSMGMAEVAYELKDTVHYVLASESMSWTTLIYDQLIPAVKRGMDGREIGEAWLKLESDRLYSSFGYPFILALYDQSQLGNLASAMETLGNTMSSVLSTDKNLITDAVTEAMRVESYYNGEINTQDSYVDLKHLATRLAAKFSNGSDVYKAAQKVKKAVNAVIIDKKHRSGNFISMPGAKYRRNFNQSSGMSVYFPSHHDEAKRKPFYTPEHLQWTADTGWHNFLAGWWPDSAVQAARTAQLTMPPTCSSAADCPELAMPLPGPGFQGTSDNDDLPLPEWMPAIPKKSVCISSTSGGEVGTIEFGDEDILCHNLPTGEITLLFDGSEQGLPNNVDLDAFHIREDGSILMSFQRPFNIDGLGRVDDSDIVRFIPAAGGGKGTWERFFTGKSAQLTKGAEDIDAIFELPDGRIVVSTLGTSYVRGVRNIKNTELFVFTPTQLGDTTAGTWKRYFRGNKEKLTNKWENIWGAAYDAEEEHIYLSTRGKFGVTGLSGKQFDIFTCKPTAANNRKCIYNAFWNATHYGFGNENIDGLHIMPVPEVLAASFMKAERTMSQPSQVAIYTEDEGGIMPNLPRTINFVVENLSDSPESYSVILENSAGWPMAHNVKAPLTLEAGETAELAVEISHNGAVTDESELILRVMAHNSSDIEAVELLELGEPEFDEAIFLPLIIKQ